MNNILAYYYSLHPDEIIHKKNSYFFNYLNSEYVFMMFERPLSDADSLYQINKQMIKQNLLVHEIKLNNENRILTYINNVPYVLMEIFVNKNARITLSEICHINNNSINVKCDNIIARYDWVNLWETKNDYLETQINEIGKKYPNLCTFANYYIGLAENAISYVRMANLLEDDAPLSICHKRIEPEGTLFELYNPIGFVCDYRVRDVSEYVKKSFFEKMDAKEIVNEFFTNNYISYKEALLFYGRLLYPSYFFDIQGKIINENADERKIEEVVSMSDEYEQFLLWVYSFLVKKYNKYIPGVDWIIKRSFI